MSSMLEQAIIDAEQLKETAQRTAEEAVIEKYQSEIKEAVNTILEQEDPLEEEEAALVVDGEGEVSIVEDLPSAQLAEEDDIVEINLDKLEELMAQEMEEGTMDPDDMLEHEQVAEEIEALSEESDLDEEIELDEDINDLLEEDDLEERAAQGFGDPGAKNTHGKDAGYTPAKVTRGDGKLHEEDSKEEETKSALQERFQKLANIIK